MKNFMTPEMAAELEGEQEMMAAEEARDEQAGRMADAVVSALNAKAPSWLSGCSDQWGELMRGVRNELHMDMNFGMEPWGEEVQSIFMAVMEAQILCEMDRGITGGDLDQMIKALDAAWLSEAAWNTLEWIEGSKKAESSDARGKVDYLDKVFAVSQARKYAHACEGRGQMQGLIAAGRAWRERVALEAVSAASVKSKSGPRV